MNAKPMSKISFKRKRGSSFRFSDKERRRLKNVSDKEAEAQALADPENPPLNEELISPGMAAPEGQALDNP